MALERYRAKRDFSLTPEPTGRAAPARAGGRSFVVQKHAATRLHFDFRLELNGVLLSWAVPKGPSLDPNDKRLAMHVEDHPLEYGEFEGVIPKKQYGAGTVMVWDRGTWWPRSDPDEAYAKGHLKFELFGEKLRGVWNLVRSRSGKYGQGGGDGWLLFKEADDHARLGPGAIVDDERPKSVLTGRTLDEIAASADRVWHSNRPVQANVASGAIGRRAKRAVAVATLVKLSGATKAPLPEAIEPQLAVLCRTPPTGTHWVHEIKHDGYRMLCRIDNGEARMQSRSGRDWTGNFPTLVRALARLPATTAWLDGEAVVLDGNGRSSFQALQNALSGGPAPSLAYVAFDLLYLDGVDLRGVALAQRKAVLEKLLADSASAVRYSAHFDVPGRDFFDNVSALGLEGMVSKRADLPYTAGRGPAWQKIKCLRREPFVVGGYTEPEGSRPGFGALLLGVPEPDGRLTYCGRVGSGFNDALLRSLFERLQATARSDTPFHNPPTGADARRARWVAPTIVVDVSYGEWTADRTLRHPVFHALRADTAPARIVRAMPDQQRDDDNPAARAAPAVQAPAATRKSTGKDAVEGIALSNADKVLYPEEGLTKRDLARYYAAVGERMLEQLRGRPLTLVRHPNGWDRKGFYQKHAEDGVAREVSRVAVDGGSATYLMAESVPAIVALLQLGALEIHPWGARVPDLDRPDRIVFDLDPDEALGWPAVREAALLVKTLMENLDLVPFLKTTGGKGLHVVVPLEPAAGWEDVKGFAKAVAELLERTFPDRFTSKLLKRSRGGRTFIDYLRNAEGATAVAAYSLRAKAHAPVSTPVAWTELGADLRHAHFNARTVPARLSKLRRDPWRDLVASARPLTPALLARVGYRREDR